MNLLAIDTSTERASLALMIDGHVHQLEAGEQRQHAQLLLPAIERLLSNASATLNQLDGIAFNRGPGSFTGLRIACSVAKGLAFARDLPLYPVSSLATIANELVHQNPDILKEHDILALIDARMQQVYWACYQQTPFEAPEKVSDMVDVLIDGKKPLVTVGVAYEDYLSQLHPLMRDRIVAKYHLYPNAAGMLRMVAHGEIKPVTAASAMPVYIRDQVTQGEKRG